MRLSDSSKAWLIAGVTAILPFAVPHLACYVSHRLLTERLNPKESDNRVGRYLVGNPDIHLHDTYFIVKPGPMGLFEPMLVGLAASVFHWFLRKRLNWPMIVTIMIVLGGVHVGWVMGWSTADWYWSKPAT